MTRHHPARAARHRRARLHRRWEEKRQALERQNSPPWWARLHRFFASLVGE